MRKVIIGILAFLYLGISSGIAMDLHYCMGKLIRVELHETHDSKNCDHCGMKAKKGCCGDDHKFYKLTDSHKDVSNDIDFSKIVIAFIHSNYAVYNTLLPSKDSYNNISNHSPPDCNTVSLCILNCVFRI
ncbi:HYC_CC_PP family protein [Ferruginibacter albus]|uniref:HYC_CC_PP family protein n=1 Tax=Ferruginibacter albus TaxID=2875540 RepID=UPI001CC5DAA0|nr:hypothetical protein [Ferruginibacter albus]UAY51362.1 hypothetical protein K9M53_12285 [Ferruginibacter albus]